MVGWHVNGHEFEQIPGSSEGQGAWRAAVCGVTESGTTERLSNNKASLQSIPPHGAQHLLNPTELIN